ncbi:hypothetical protein PIIN_10985 [Serendipita indica DSM 11827]|uniref:Uncharacterized protein n=1 Tax=Serendipita indica (strain DSM 11827) TaxID=1109443 RepID=G4U0A7_SERID|nr:hypothetical protein PIIN_10985 [Serendipita indica DSM 11827]
MALAQTGISLSSTPRKTSQSVEQATNSQDDLTDAEYDANPDDWVSTLFKYYVQLVQPGALLDDFPATSAAGALEAMRDAFSKEIRPMRFPNVENSEETNETEESTIKKEREMYSPLRDSFNDMLSSVQTRLRCFNIDSHRPMAATSQKMSPDLAFALDYQIPTAFDQDKVFLHPAVYVEVKRNYKVDIPFRTSTPQSPGTQQNLLTEQTKLLKQVPQYVYYGQLPWLP